MNQIRELAQTYMLRFQRVTKMFLFEKQQKNLAYADSVSGSVLASESINPICRLTETYLRVTLKVETGYER